MKWARLAEIRNHSLAKFLEDTSSREEALKKFADTQIEDPPLDEIDAYFASFVAANQVDHASEGVEEATSSDVDENLTDDSLPVVKLKKRKNAT